MPSATVYGTTQATTCFSGLHYHNLSRTRTDVPAHNPATTPRPAPAPPSRAGAALAVRPLPVGPEAHLAEEAPPHVGLVQLGGVQLVPRADPPRPQVVLARKQLLLAAACSFGRGGGGGGDGGFGLKAAAWWRDGWW